MKTKVLISGGCGYIGGFVVNLFLQDDKYDVTVYDNLSFERSYLKKVKFIKGDIRDYDKLSKIVNDYDVIIALAGLVGDGSCEINREVSHDVNVKSVEWLAKNFNGYICFPSSCSVFGTNDDLLDEKSPTRPLSWYAHNKLEAEQALIKYHNGCSIFRLGTVYGLSDSFCRMRFDLVANVLSARAAQGLDITVFGGEQWRPLIHVEDIATAMKAAVDNNVRGIYNLVDDNWKISDLAKTIVAQVENCKINYSDVPFEDTRNYKVTGEKFLKLNIWKPEKNLITSVRELIQVIRENRFVNVNDPVYYNVTYMKENNGKFQ